MRNSFKRFPSLMTLSILSYCVLFSALLVDDTYAQSCSISICKSADDSDGILFPFVQESTGGSIPFELTGVDDQGSCSEISIPLNDEASVFELPVFGWSLADIDCNLIGVNYEITEGGVVIECLTPTANGTCTFLNVPGEITPVTNIPTLSEWGAIAMTGILGAIGLYVAARRRKATA